MHDYLLKAGVPSRSYPPTYISSTGDTVTIQIYPAEYNNGAPILGYEVWRDEGENLTLVNIQETGYDGTSMTYTAEGLDTGVLYKFATLSFNSEGAS